jgi:hypothetical protein
MLVDNLKMDRKLDDKDHLETRHKLCPIYHHLNTGQKLYLVYHHLYTGQVLFSKGYCIFLSRVNVQYFVEKTKLHLEI